MSGNKILRLGVELTGEEGYKAGLKKLEDGMKNVSAAQKLLNAQYDSGDKSLAKVSQQQELLKQKLELQKKKLQEIRAEYDRVSASEGKNSEAAQKLARDYTYAEAACAQTEKELNGLGKEFQTASSRVEQFKKKLQEGESQLEKIGKKISDVGTKLTTRLTVPIAAGATAAIKLFTDFEDEMTVVSTIADETAMSMEDMSDATLKASNKTGTAATELAQAEYQAISAGVETAKSVDFVATSAKAAKAGLTDTTTAVDGATSAMNAWKISTDQATTVYDKMITAQNFGKTTLGDIAGQIGNLTGLAPQLNVSLDETLAATAALTKNGVKTSTAMNELKAIMSAVLKPTSEATEYAKKLGLEFDATALQSKGLTGFLADVIDKTGGSDEALATLFGSVEGLSSVMLLGKGAANDYAEALEQIENSAGAMETAFETRTSSKAEKAKKALNELKNEGIKLGQTLSPAVELATNALSGLAGVLERMTPEQQKTAITIAAITAGIGPLVLGIGKTVTAIGKVKKAFSALSALVGGAGPLALVIAGIAAATAGIVLLKNKIEDLKFSSQVKEAFSDITIDVDAVNAAIEQAEGIKDEIDLTAKAKIKLDTDSQDLQDEIIAWLTDGKRETRKQKEEYKAKVDELFQPVFDAVQTSFDEKKAALDEALAQGIISPEQYQKSLDDLNTTTENTKTALEAEKQAYVDYVIALANSNRKPTEDEIAKLEELRQKVVDVAAEILDAQNTALQAAKASYNLATAGAGSTADVAIAVTYAQTTKATKTDAAESLHKQAMAALQQKFADAEAAGDNEVQAQVLIDMQTESGNYDEQVAKIEDEYTQMMTDIAAGIAEKYPDQAAKIKEVAAEEDLYEQILSAITSVRSDDTTQEEKKAGQQIIQEMYDNMFGAGSFENLDYKEQALAADKMMSQLGAQIKDGMKGIDFKGTFEDLSAAIGAGALSGLDVSSVGDTMKNMLTVLDLSDDGKTAGINLIEGEKTGILENQESLNNAIIQSCTEANNALTSTQKINSPSKVWTGFGGYMMGGLERGIDKGKPAVLASVKNLSGSLYTVGQNSIQGLINGANSKRSALIATYQSIAAAALRAAQNKLEVHSPSKAFFRIGANTGEGMVRGLISKVNAVRRAMSTVANPENADQTQTGGGTQAKTSGGNQQKIVINVNYSGAVTNRDSRRLAQQLGRYVTSQQAAKGM